MPRVFHCKVFSKLHTYDLEFCETQIFNNYSLFARTHRHYGLVTIIMVSLVTMHSFCCAELCCAGELRHASLGVSFRAVLARTISRNERKEVKSCVDFGKKRNGRKQSVLVQHLFSESSQQQATAAVVTLQKRSMSRADELVATTDPDNSDIEWWNRITSKHLPPAPFGSSVLQLTDICWSQYWIYNANCQLPIKNSHGLAFY